MLSERIIDKLLVGDIEFMERLSREQLEYIAKGVVEYPNRKALLYASFRDLVNFNPEYAFKMTYDLPEYEEYWYRYFTDNYEVLTDDYRFLLFYMLSSNLAVKMVSERLDKIVLTNKETIYSIVRHAERTKNYYLLNKLAFHKNLDIRGMFMVEIAESFYYLLDVLYSGDILSNLAKLNNDNEVELMDEKYLSKIAFFALGDAKDKVMYDKLKDFILRHYEKNSLAAELDRYGKLSSKVYPQCEEAIIEDIDELFVTSKQYKFGLSKRYGEYLDSGLLNEFRNSIKSFTDIDSEIIEAIFINGLGDKFLSYVDKYLSMSTGAKVISDVGRGSCTRTFRIGDFVIKCSDKKWSLEDKICPSNYLILKNLEEDIVRKDNGEVTGAIEVQRYLSRPLLVSEVASINLFQEAFRKSGYYIEDKLVDDEFGPNCRHLDDYRQADCDEPESLPEWFKKDPVVLVDRDLVFSVNNKKPKMKCVNY